MSVMINPRIDASTPVIVQGMTGRAGRLHTRLMREYGTNVVAGVSRRMETREVDGVPIFETCEDAVKATGARASIAFVGAFQLLDAMREAVSAGVSYLVTPTEGMPVHVGMKARELTLKAGVTWIGASTPGMAVPGAAKLGFLPNDALRPGPLGLMSKSGTLSYEAGYRVAQRGVGQSVWVGVGGDPVKGLRYADLVPFYASDEQTRALLIIGEIGGHEEEEFAAQLKAQAFGKPVFALIAGSSAPEGVTMGHAGALVHGAHGSYASKAAALKSAGVEVFATLEEMERVVCAVCKRPEISG
jgi:succinyl-CoA synthetase alpha subunit